MNKFNQAALADRLARREILPEPVVIKFPPAPFKLTHDIHPVVLSLLGAVHDIKIAKLARTSVKHISQIREFNNIPAVRGDKSQWYIEYDKRKKKRNS